MSVRPFMPSSYYHRTCQRTKARFFTVLAETTKQRAPTKIVVSGDSTVADEITSAEGFVSLEFDSRTIVMSNHQIYADWCFLWFCAYLAKTHHAVFIVLKNALKYIPLLGLGLIQWGFIFLCRDWTKDETTLSKHLNQLRKDAEQPMWLVLFPEGTNYCPKELARSKAYVTSRSDSDHVPPNLTRVLLPRTRGLRKSIEILGNSITHIYDCTVAYSPIPESGFPSAAYTLRSVYVHGQPPECVHMHWHKIPVAQIPIHDEQAFEDWLYGLWAEKDRLLCKFYETGEIDGAAVSHECELGLRSSRKDEMEYRMRGSIALTTALLHLAKAVSRTTNLLKNHTKGLSLQRTT